MKTKFYFSVLALALFIIANNSITFAQGCVAVRNMNSCSMGDSLSAKSIQVGLNYRYFRSFRHFSGTHEHTERVENGTEVINSDNSIILSVSYNLSNRWSAAVSVPFIYIDRSSMYEHKGNNSGERYHTSSNGLGDIRISGYYAATPYSHKMRLNFGLGIKLPTGDYNYKDYFHREEGLVLRPVDQSIQLGDGGTGLITEVDYTYLFSHRFNGYATGYYLFNPRNTNGTLRSASLTDNIPLSNEMSVVDQFLIRLGARYNVKAFQFGVGGRYEGIPVEDLLGDSDGFRRPGYILSVEPSVSFSSGKHSMNLVVPIALERNRTRSVIDKQRGVNPQTNKPYHGDAAFADWLVSISYAYRIR